MLLQLISFELQKAFNKRANQIFFLILFVLGFLIIHAAAGFFDFIKIVLVGENMHLNGANIIDSYLGYFRIFLIFVVAATVSSIVFADYKHNTLSMTFTSGVSKSDYIISKLIASFIIASIIMSATVFGHMLACVMPYLDASYFNEFNLIFYVSPYFKNYLLNIFIMVSIFMSFTMIFRSSLVNWVLVILFYGINIVSAFYYDDIDTSVLGALLDPTGALASDIQTHGMSAEQLDTQTLNMQGVYLYNRLLWFGIGLLSLIVIFFRFDFQYKPSFFGFRKKTSKNKVVVNVHTVFQLSKISHTSIKYERNLQWNIWLKSYINEFKFITLSVHYGLTILIGLAMIMITHSSTGNMYETASYPVTFEMVELIKRTFNTLLIFFIILMSGELIWRERASKCNEINDALPISSSIPATSKIMALISSVAVLLLLFIGSGVFIQYSNDFYDYQLGQYFISIFGFEFIDYVLFTVLAFFMHTLINNKYLTIMLLLIYYFADIFGVSFFEHNLLKFNSAPTVTYSDLNGYGNNVLSFLVFKIYWLLFALAVLLFANLLWVRGEAFELKIRIKSALKDFNIISKPLIIIMILFVTTGGIIFYNTNVLNSYVNTNNLELRSVAYEKKYKHNQGMDTPEIMEITVNVDIFPESKMIKGHGVFELKNTSDHNLDEIHLSFDSKVNANISFSRNVILSYEDDVLNYYIYQLKQALKVDETLSLSFDFMLKQTGFKNSGSTAMVNNNGTFINSSEIFPTFGYDSSLEIMGKRLRTKHSLPERPLARSRDDKNALKNSLFGSSSHFTNINVTVSTSKNQTAFTSGNLINQWQKNGRNYFHYKNNAKVQNFIPFISGNYAVKSDVWQDENKQSDPVEIHINYLASHHYNIDKIMQSAKDSLDYYTSHFSAFSQNQLRIIEFPRTYGSFAQSFPGVVPFSETIGFLTDLRNLDKQDTLFQDQIIDVAYFVTAHEIAHQWWGHQVSSANVEGVNFLIESLSEYSALKVMEHKYGKQKIKKFLRTETVK